MTHSVPLNDPTTCLAENRAGLEEAIGRILDSGWLVLGQSVKKFECAFAKFVGETECIGVGNGTDALELALRCVGVSAGERVATVANAGGYTSTALLCIGAEPWFLDVEAETQLPALSDIERALKAGVRAVVVTHLYGRIVPDVERIAAACAQAGVPLIEDCAQAHGARLGGRSAGSFGDLACFSFYLTKNLGALGDGGAVLTSNAGHAERLRLLRQYGWRSKYEMTLAGARNSRLDELQAAVLLVLLEMLDGRNARRRKISNRYSAEIRNDSVILPAVSADEYVAHLYVLRSRQRDALRAFLTEAGIGTDVHYPIPDHRQPVFAGRYDDVSLPVTERLVSEILTIPCYPELSDEQVDRVIDTVNRWRP